ncbi:MAG TPA: hypothetical protein VMV41_12650 [Cellulomonadaceae bacterium]|nr:hypothetical protein [Cellulomonadaceae bacterium]
MESSFTGAGVSARRRRTGVLAVILVVVLAACAGPRVPAGDQPTVGVGWRLLGQAEGAGAVYRTGVATTDGQLAALWRQSGLGREAPAVDWRAEIAVWFGAVYSSGCPVRLDGVVVDGATLHGQFVVPGSGPGSACAGDARPHSFVVAVKRTMLPTGPFVVQLNAANPPLGASKERTVVDVDLSAAGSTASAAQLTTNGATLQSYDAVVRVKVGLRGGPLQPTGGMALEGKPAADVNVTARDARGATWDATTDQQGVAQLRLSPGAYVIFSTYCGPTEDVAPVTTVKSGDIRTVEIRCDVP